MQWVEMKHQQSVWGEKAELSSTQHPAHEKQSGLSQNLLVSSQFPFYGRKGALCSDANRKRLLSAEVRLPSPHRNEQGSNLSSYRNLEQNTNQILKLDTLELISCKFVHFHLEVKLSSQPRVSEGTVFVWMDPR